MFITRPCVAGPGVPRGAGVEGAEPRRRGEMSKQNAKQTVLDGISTKTLTNTAANTLCDIIGQWLCLRHALRLESLIEQRSL